MTDNLSALSSRHFVSSDVLDRVAQLAVTVDCDSTADRRPVLRELANEGVLDLGLPGSNGTYLDQVRVLAVLAGACMTTAFSAWAHRMSVEYIAGYAGEGFANLAAKLRAADIVGSTAMAATFRAASGQDELTVSLSDHEDGTYRATGFISWASNLHDDAVVVTGMLHNGQRKIVTFNIDQPGVEVLHSEKLLALDASQSGAMRLEDVRITPSQIVDVDFVAFVKSVRPTFLAFQSAFCVGLAAASLAAIHELRGVGVSLADRLAENRSELARLSDQLEQVAVWLDHREGEIPLNVVRLRLDAAHLAISATQLELAIRGGQAYSAKSPTARRVREALFLPVQSPTEAQLQWELQHSV
jgi:alkylation response protein AidB-like acyl-CoA dehydrogenase